MSNEELGMMLNRLWTNYEKGLMTTSEFQQEVFQLMIESKLS